MDSPTARDSVSVEPPPDQQIPLDSSPSKEMAPPKSKKPQNHPDGEQCEVCGLVLARRGDMPRHMRTHLEDKSHMLHRCTWEGCDYSSLQRGNVDTHYRTHTKEQTHICPDCEFKSVDGGSLTRHRRRKHGYVPKPRKSRYNAPQPLTSTSATPEPSTSTAASRASRRHQPYSRPPSESCESSNRSSPTPERESSTTPAPADVTTTTAFPVIIPDEPNNMTLVLSDCKALATGIDACEDYPLDFMNFWQPRDSQDYERIGRGPKAMHAAADATYQMQDSMPLLITEKGSVPPFSYLGWTLEDLIESPNASAMQAWDLNDEHLVGCLNLNPPKFSAKQDWDLDATAEDAQVDVHMGEQCVVSLPPVVEEMDMNRMAPDSDQSHAIQWDTTSYNVPSYPEDSMFDYDAMYDGIEPPPLPYDWLPLEPYSAAPSATSLGWNVDFGLTSAASSPYSSTIPLDPFLQLSTDSPMSEDPSQYIPSPQSIPPLPLYPSTPFEWEQL
ncbi:hypothetical protein AAF712_006882 [Marasmius tenuissimus]|uniref:C2H2-type domain-containing protein n=1 Tax=Marasmius tenuissimus TaxID=585030 RepID=A0ABR2ZZ38_9AGAR|nr:hypothetical protein PM082_010354 [Marasmius tenuissimus]